MKKYQIKDTEVEWLYTAYLLLKNPKFTKNIKDPTVVRTREVIRKYINRTGLLGSRRIKKI